MDDKAKAGKKLGTADIATVMKLLPHRYPFLLVDRMYDMNADESCVGVKNVTINEPFFQGHFPQFPVMPGVLIIEGLAQTAGALCVSNVGEDYRAELVYFMGIDNAKFRKPVLPGDQLHYHVQQDPQPRPRLALPRRSEGEWPGRGGSRNQRNARRFRRRARLCEQKWLTSKSTRLRLSRTARGLPQG